MPDPIPVIMAAGGAGWEAPAVGVLASARRSVVLFKRCVDLTDLLATASTGQARVAVLDEGLAGLDTDSVAALRHAGVGVVIVDGEPQQVPAGRARRFGVRHVVPVSELDSLPRVALEADLDRREPVGGEGVESRSSEDRMDEPAARLLAVWGPTGAPGRTTLAVNLAAELAARSQQTLLLDVDAFGGAVAQHLGILDEMSGLLAAARLANAGQLDPARLASVARQVGSALRVLTGLPRSDRWPEVRDAAFELVLEVSRATGQYVVLDTGFSLEQDPRNAFGVDGPRRHGMTLASVQAADEVLVVGAADPVGLSRLARALVELGEVAPGATLRVVVNRARPALGWGEPEIRAMVEGFVVPASMHFLPDDRAAADRALVAGKSLVEMGDSPLRRGITAVADAVTGVAAGGRSRRSRRRGPGRRARARSFRG